MLLNFGKSFTYTVTAYDDGSKIPSIPTQTVDAFIFDTRPSRADASDGTGAIQSQNYSHTADDIIEIPFDAVDDPEPTGTISRHTYYVAVNFVLEAAEQVQTIIREVIFERVSAKDKIIGVTRDQIEQVYPDIYSFLSDAQVEAHIELARKELIADLKNQGTEWSQVHNPDELYNALLFKALQYVHASQIQRQGDRFSVLENSSKAAYQSVIRNLKLTVDSDKDGAPDSQRRTGGLLIAVR